MTSKENIETKLRLKKIEPPFTIDDVFLQVNDKRVKPHTYYLAKIKGPEESSWHTGTFFKGDYGWKFLSGGHEILFSHCKELYEITDKEVTEYLRRRYAKK